MSIRPEATASTTAWRSSLGAQRRLHLEEGAVVRNVVFVQRQVVWIETPAGHVQAVALGPVPARAQGAGGRHLVEVVARAGHLQQRDITVRCPSVRPMGRHGREALQRRELSGGGAGAPPRGPVPGYGPAPAHRGRGRRSGARCRTLVSVTTWVAIGEGHGAGIHQEADLGHLAPLPALGQRGHRQDAPPARLRARGRVTNSSASGLSIEGSCCRGRVDDGGDAAGGRGASGGAKALLVGARPGSQTFTPMSTMPGARYFPPQSHDLGGAMGLCLGAGGQDATLTDQQAAGGLGARLGGRSGSHW